MELSRRAAGDKRARQRLIEKNLRLVVAWPRGTGTAASLRGLDPGGQHRADEGGREVRPRERLPLLHLRDVVDQAGDAAAVVDKGRDRTYPVHMSEKVRKTGKARDELEGAPRTDRGRGRDAPRVGSRGGTGGPESDDARLQP